VFFEVIPKPNGCYDGRMRVGGDTHSPGEYSERFALGNTEQTLSFIQNLRDLEIIVRFFSLKISFPAQYIALGESAGKR
jgi:hypothetical protein